MNFWLASLATSNSKVSVKFTLLTIVKTHREDGQGRSLFRMEYFLKNSHHLHCYFGNYLYLAVHKSFSVVFSAVYILKHLLSPFHCNEQFLEKKIRVQHHSWKPFQQTFSAHHSFQGVYSLCRSLSWCGQYKFDNWHTLV